MPANIEMVTANFAGVLRVGAAAGRWFSPGDDAFSADPVTVIGYRFWQSKLNGAPDAVGSKIRFTIATTASSAWRHRIFTAFCLPSPWTSWTPAASIFPSGAGPRLNLIARLAPGATPDTVAAEMRVLSASLRTAEPRNANLASLPVVKPAQGFIANRNLFLPLARLLAAICGAVLLIASVNVANLLLSRAAVRQREMALRRSLGAGSWRLFRETLVEGLVLASGGLVLGIAAGYWSSRAIELALPSVPVSYYRGIHFGIDWRVALFLCAAGTLCAILFSLPPALAAARQLHPALQGEAARRRFRQREVYSLAQVALSLALLIAAGLLVRALDRVRRIDPGFATDHRLFVTARAIPKDPQLSAQAWTDALDQARALPGVRGATLAYGAFPATGAGCAAKAEAEAPVSVNQARTIRIDIVEPNYFALMRVPIVRGRGFDVNGGATATPAVIVNRTMAELYWPEREPLGKRLWLGCSTADRRMGEVVGVAANTKTSALDEDPAPVFYVSRLQEPAHPYFALIVETEGDARAWTTPLLRIVQRNHNLEYFEAQTLDEAVGKSLWLIKWQAALLAVFGLLAIVLATIGLYGVVAYAVSQRTHEIGVRMALGAMPGDVRWMILSHGLRITVFGVGAGLLLSAATVRLLRGFLYGLSPFDPVAFATASLAWVLIAMLASWYPARRATRVDPLAALKYE